MKKLDKKFTEKLYYIQEQLKSFWKKIRNCLLKSGEEWRGGLATLSR